MNNTIVALTKSLKDLDLLCDQEVALGIVKELIELQYVRMVHLLQNADLTEQFLFLFLFKVLFVDDFDSSEGIGLF